MTRFARAKGSKSSNERAPEDGTPWEVMKEQLVKAKKEGEDAKKRLEAEQMRIENFENFLKDQKVQKRQATWCDFPESVQTVKKPKKNKKKDSNDNLNNYDTHGNELTPQDKSHNEEIDNDNPFNKQGAKKNKKKKNKKVTDTVNPDSTTQNNVKVDDTLQEINAIKKKKKNKKSTETLNTENTTHIISIKDSSITLGENSNDQKAVKRNKKSKKGNVESYSSAINVPENEPQQNPKHTITSINDNQSEKNQQNTPKKKKNKNFVDGKPIRRKPEADRSFQLIVNGKEIELVRFDGFPIMKRDADRLALLKGNMIKKGIPKSEVNRTIKLERRRAEKALARLKKDVCYNCRKGGHNLSDCPELKSKIAGVDVADGVCFKCGSTEHRQFECKVQRDKEFRFASCFICREQGHIARQCPDNPKGLYPNGGSCKLCGDVTHLRKDCPTVQDKREESNVKLNTLDATDDNIEDIVHKPVIATSTETTIKKPKKISF